MPDPWHILAEIADERQRQVDVEGNTPSMDDNEGNAQLARAAARATSTPDPGEADGAAR